MNRSLEYKIEKVRGKMVFQYPFFSVLSMKLPITIDNAVKTACTDGTEIRINPEFFEKLPEDEQLFLYCHELGHVALLHPLRRNNRDPERWNVACDYVLNSLLKEHGLSLPDGGLYDWRYDGMSEEEVYSNLPEELSEKEKNSGGYGLVKDPTDDNGNPLPDAQKKKLENDLRPIISSARNLSQKAGKFGGGMDRKIGDILNPKLSWKELLREYVSLSIKQNLNWNRPNKRYINTGCYMPSIGDKIVGNVVVAVDTSGSVRAEDLAQFSAEINDILMAYSGLTLEVVYCDTEVRKTEEIESHDLPVKLSFNGGGGTRFAPVFEYIEKNIDEVHCLIYFTDLCCNDYPRNAPEYPVIWITNNNNEAKFGRTIKM